MPLFDYVCPECSNAEIHFLPMSQCTEPQPCSECGAMANRAYIGAPSVNDSTSAIHIVKPDDYKMMIRQAKADNAWKKEKDKKKRETMKKEAADLKRFKT